MSDKDKATGKAASGGKATGKAPETGKDKLTAEVKTGMQKQADETNPEAMKPYKDGGKRVSGKIRIRLLYKYGFYPPGANIYVDEAVGLNMIKTGTAKEVK